MAESTLSLKKSTFEMAIGHYLGYGRGTVGGDTAWSTTQQTNITFVLDSALRRFYHNAVIEETGGVHSWSFLKPLANVVLAEGASTAELPDDFARVEGDIVVSSSSNANWTPVKTYHEGQIAALYAANASATGAPQFAAVQQLRARSVNESQRKRLYVYPAADQEWTLRMNYVIAGEALTGSHPYAYGGVEHAETILAGCLAAAERVLDNKLTENEAYYRQCLASSIQADRKAKPQAFGRNRDTSDELHNAASFRRDVIETTFAGVSWN